MPTFDWNDLFENAGNIDNTPPPSDTYLCVIEDASWGKTQKGKDMLKYRARIIAGPQKNKAFFGNVVVSPDNPMALQIGLRHLEALGLDRGALTGLTEREQEDLVSGQEVLIESTTREYKGEIRSEVKDLKASQDVATKAPSGNTPPPAKKAATDTPPDTSSNTPPPAPFSD